LRLDNRRVLITGAGSGIGRAIAVRLAGPGSALVLTGRRAEPLYETASLVTERGGAAHVLTADLSDPAAPARVVAEAVDTLGGLDILINNAGNVRAGDLDAIGEEDIQAMITVDLLAPVLLARAALPHLRKAAEVSGHAPGSAGILGISSGIALVGLPFYGVYAGAKAGLARFDESLRRELLGTGVAVATAYPGATETAMMDTNHAGDDLGFARRPVEDVADDIVAGLRAGEVEINTAPPERAAMQELNRTDPDAVDRKLAPLLPSLRQAVSTHRAI
jgi:uncharacterized protein